MRFACKYFWRFVVECLGWFRHQTYPPPWSRINVIPPLPTRSVIFSWLRGKQKVLFAKGLDLPFLPRILIFPSCFHSILLQFAIFSLQQFSDMGLLSHTTFLSSLAKIRMGVTSSFLESPYSKISSVSLQRYSPIKNTQNDELLSPFVNVC